MIYIVTGSTGFVGNNVVKALEARGDVVVAMAQTPAKVARALKGTRARIVYGDVLKKDKLELLFCEAKKAAEGSDKTTKTELTVIHTASVVYLGGDKKKLQRMREVNIDGAKNIIELCLRHKCRLLYVSSVHAIPEAPNRGVITETKEFDHKKVIGKYAKTKAEASQLVMDAVKNKGLDAVMVHPSAISGPHDYSNTHTTQVVQDYKDGRIPVATKGGYDFVDVRDVTTGILAACEKGKKGDCYLLTNRYYTVKHILNTLHILGVGKQVRRSVPRALAKMSLPIMAIHNKFARKRPLYNSYALYTLGSNSNFSHEKATCELGYAPRELQESLRDTVKFLEKQDREKR